MNLKIIFAVLFLIPTFLWAEETPLSLETAIHEVLKNPDIQAAGYRTSAAKARISQAKALEDPEVGVQFYDVPIDTIDVKQGMEINYMIEQKIPFPGKRWVKGKVARWDAETTNALSNAQIRNVLLDLKRTYYTLYRLDRSIEVNRENQGLLKQFLGSTETSYATGKIGVDAPLKAQVELSKLENEGLLLEQERTTHLAHLKALLNRSSHGEIRLPSTLKWPHLKKSLEEIRKEAASNRPELVSLRAMEKREKSKLTAARQSLIPDFSLGFEYNQRPNQIDAWTGTAQMNLPIFFWGKNRAEIREAKANLKATESEHQSMEIHTVHEIEQAYSAAKTSEKVVSSYEKGLLPQAKTTLESARLSYAANKIDFLTLIDAARTYKDLQMSYYDQQSRLGISFAELERLVGKE